MIVTVPVWSYHYDERYWPDPYEFKPERFMSENKDNIKSGTYLPFGVGPRNCIGQRFALMEAKLVIAKVMLNFEVSLAPEHETISYNRRPGTMRPSDDFRLAFIPLPSPV
ncbi:Cytochrome P450 3A4 [Halocaridina rubra]|uniref:Cytochrome P450 3A4 n=1 Tax=Halocaridina rubra TaxID=373956 RepID=A0AAN8WU58_HALRR